MKELIILKELILISQINQRMLAYELKNIAILNVKGVDYRCILWNMTKDDANNLLHNSWLGNKGVL